MERKTGLRLRELCTFLDPTSFRCLRGDQSGMRCATLSTVLQYQIGQRMLRYSVFLGWTVVLMTVWPAATQTVSPASKEPEWTEYVYPSDGFAIKLPDAPQSSTSGQLPGGTEYKLVIPQRPGNLWVALHTSTFQDGCGDAFNRYLDLVKRSPPPGESKTSVPVHEVNIAGHTAMEMEWENNPNNEKYTFHEFFQCVEQEVLHLRRLVSI